MKKNILSRTMILLGILIASFSYTGLNAQESGNFITNEEKQGDLIVSKVIYRLDGSLYRHMKYDFTYDEQKRMTSKEAFKWDSRREKWSPYFKIDYTYSDGQITLTYARWNEAHKAYDAQVEKSVYELNENNIPVACVNYQWKNDKPKQAIAFPQQQSCETLLSLKIN